VNALEVLTALVTIFGFIYLLWALMRAEDF
jgi:K+-transporting ATPase KdpF subunit